MNSCLGEVYARVNIGSPWNVRVLPTYEAYDGQEGNEFLNPLLLGSINTDRQIPRDSVSYEYYWDTS